MSMALVAERLFARKETRVADAGQAAVFLKANVLVATFIRFLEFNIPKHVIDALFQSFFCAFCHFFRV